jgi:ABC-2 type transport system ATP-binding protein
MNLLRPTSGSARILGETVDSVPMRRRIGYLPETPYFYDYLTAAEFLTYVGRLFGIGSAQLARKVETLLAQVGLLREADVQLRKFSKGMVQRIGIAQAIINDPEVVFLDEPMSGLDPLGRREVRDVIVSLKSRGVTVFFSSHILPDVEALCDRVAILNRGSLIEAGALHDILKVRISGHEIILSNVNPGLCEAVRRTSQTVAETGDRLQVRASTPDQLRSILSLALSNGAGLISINPVRPSLEDFFLDEVQRTGDPN